MKNKFATLFLFSLVFIFPDRVKALDNHFYECPIKSVCQLIIDHYRMDATKSLMFEGYKNLKIREGEIKKDRNLFAVFNAGVSLNHNSSGNVITLYDGIGIQNDAVSNRFSSGTYNLAINYDFTPMSIKLEQIQSDKENEYYRLRQDLFEDLFYLFPRFSQEALFTRRPVFSYLYEFDRIKAFQLFVDDLKIKYKKVIKLYRKKAVTIEQFKTISDMMVDASSELFDAQSMVDAWYYPDEKRFKKKLALLRGSIEKKRPLSIAVSIEEKEDKICSMVEFLDRQESILLGRIKFQLENNEARLGFNFGNIQMNNRGQIQDRTNIFSRENPNLYDYNLLMNFTGEFSKPSNFSTQVGANVNYRLFDTTNNYINKILFRRERKNLSKVYNDLRFNESERVDEEARSYYNVKKYYQNSKFNYEQKKIFKKSYIKGSLFKGNLKIKNVGFVKQIQYMQEHVIDELLMKYAESIFMNNLFRVKSICYIADEIIKDVL